MNPLVIIGLVLLGFIVSFLTGRHFALQQYSKKLIDNYLFGQVIVDMSSVDKDLLTMELERNPKEMLDMNYVIFEVKIRQ